MKEISAKTYKCSSYKMQAVVGIPFALPKTALGFGRVSASQDIPAPASQAAQGKSDTPAVLLSNL
jgi:hypothetical protein